MRMKGLRRGGEGRRKLWEGGWGGRRPEGGAGKADGGEERTAFLLRVLWQSITLLDCSKIERAVAVQGGGVYSVCAWP